MKRDTDGGVQSVRRALELIDAIADHAEPVALSWLALQVDLPVPTVHRLLKTLDGAGYIRQLPSKQYTLGTRLLRLGDLSARALTAMAMPFLEELVEATGETANLAVLEGDLVVYIAQAPSKHTMRIFTDIGHRVLPHSTGVGKAILSTMPEDAMRALIERTGTPALTPRTVTDVAALSAELLLIRERGWAEDNGEHELGVRCFASALAADGPLPAAISVSGPEIRLNRVGVDSVAPVVRDAAVRLSQALRSGA